MIRYKKLGIGFGLAIAAAFLFVLTPLKTSAAAHEGFQIGDMQAAKIEFTGTRHESIKVTIKERTTGQNREYIFNQASANGTTRFYNLADDTEELKAGSNTQIRVPIDELTKSPTTAEVHFQFWSIAIGQYQDYTSNSRKITNLYPLVIVPQCEGWLPPTPLNPNEKFENAKACQKGADGKNAGKTKNATCTGLSGSQKTACEGGFDSVTLVSETTDDADASSCENTSLVGNAITFFACPVLGAIGDLADTFGNVIINQLNFNVNQNLNPNVKQAWNIFRILTSALLVILLLVMVISQAAGGGPFEAYTIRKLLPKLVIAIILIQLSWFIYRYFVVLSNAAGQGISDILALPFGGKDNLEFEKLLGSLGWGAVGGTLLVSFLSIVVVSIINPFGALLVVFLVAIALIVGVAVVLFRNALIIGGAIFFPVFLAAWILPGTQSYWKLFQSNISKALMLFPLLASVVTIGHIFAYIVGASGGNPGALDIFAIILGYFGVYFLFPKAFSWGGSLISSAAGLAQKGIAPVKKVGQNEIKGIGERRQGKYAKAYNPNENLRMRTLRRIQSGSFIPTRRGQAIMIQKGEKWSSDEDAIFGTKLKREQDKAASEGTIGYQLDEDGKVVAKKKTSTGAGKAALFNAMGRPDNRESGMAIERALKTSSWVEVGSLLVPVEDEGLKAEIRASGAEVFEDDPEGKGRIFVRAYDLPRWTSKINASEDLYPLPMSKYTMATPHITNPAGGGMAESMTKQLQEEENNAAAEEGRAPSAVNPVSHQAARAIETMRGYIDANSINNQSESEIREFGRLAKQDSRVGNEFAKLLMRIGDGSPGGTNALSNLASSASATEAVNAVLDNATIKNANGTNLTIQQLRDISRSGGRRGGAQQTTTSGGTASGGGNASGTSGTGNGGNGGPSGGGTGSPGGPQGGPEGGSGSSGSGSSGGSAGFGGATWSGAPAPAAPLDYDQLGSAVERAVERGTRRAHENIRGTSVGTEGTLSVPHDNENDQEGNPPQNPPEDQNS